MTPPLQKLPLHIVAEILGHLDTIQELGPPILSHRIFHEALYDNLHTITRRIFTRKVPDGILPYYLILLKTMQIKVTDQEAVSRVVARLENIEPCPSLVHLSLSEYTFLSRNHEAVEWMSQDMADELIPAMNAVGLTHSATLSDNEVFRMYRAFIRYQILCNLFCPCDPGEVRDASQLVEAFCRASSQWVNDQLVGVYTYLERRVSTAFDQVAAHNVEWAAASIHGNEPFDHCDRVQRLLCRGLPFLCSISRAKTYDERSNVLELKTLRSSVYMAGSPYHRISLLMWGARRAGPLSSSTWGMQRRGPPVSTYTAEDFEQEACASDGPQDSTDSSSFRIWFAFHSNETPTSYLDRTLSSFAYTMWDNADLSVEELSGICRDITQRRGYFKRYKHGWTEKETRLSKKRMKDIYQAGGRGYWPKGGFDDFGGITCVRDRRREQLLGKWRKATENGEDEDPGCTPPWGPMFKFGRRPRRRGG